MDSLPDEGENHEERSRAESQFDFSQRVLFVRGQVCEWEPLDGPDLVPGPRYELRIVGHTGYDVQSSQLVVDRGF